ncbi:hypothetical protein MGYG_02113 [Nannizzia gypsea CBS 118893]|uniref:Uncharacterized protein n=1 Tax=Arthroderma gypseum (strain ATCC MYA-4604 / CBS 118893) TaxID=535722 RepID=E4UPR2_ARTGP|nr:hypothetical protein MGYG_02113 [Nannizzia gypsea CBS 118893]EFQ99099.1 hypothetical protein MGYG_02113 [Nannizzia gypsea CBS 118893]
MDLASVVGPPAGLDAALMFGFSSADRRPRGEASFGCSGVQYTRIKPLPSPLAPPPEHPSELRREKDIPPALECVFGDSNISLNTIRCVLRDVDINLRAQPKLSKMIFDHILTIQKVSRWATADLHAFLLDPSLNTPGSNNYTALMDYLTLEKLALPIIIEHICQLRIGLTLGTVPLAEIQNIIVKLPHVNAAEDSFAHSQRGFLVSAYTELWTGLRECSVLTASDLGTSTLKLWLDIMLGAPAGTESIALCNHIVHALRKRDRLDQKTMSKVLLYTLEFATENQAMPRKDGWINRKSLQYRLQEISDTLRYSSRTFAISSILGTTEYLICSPNYDANRPQMLLLWSWMLQRLVGLRDMLSSEIWMEFQAPWPNKNQPDKPLTTEEVCFVRMWLLRTIGRRTKWYFDVDSRRMDLFGKHLLYLKQVSGLHGRGDMLAKVKSLMARFDNLGLPCTDHVLVTAVRSKYMERMGLAGPLPQSMISVINSLDCGVLHKPEFMWTYEKGTSVKSLGNALFEQAALETDITDPHFLHRLLLYTESNAIHSRGVLLRLIENHKPLRYALQKLRLSQPDKDAVVEVTRYLPEGVPILDPQACLNTITFLALVFAIVPVSDRVAWRLTYRCCKLLRTQNAPILPAMCRALYHAGIQRWVDSGSRVPYERRKYIMDILREVEGPQVGGLKAS